MKTRVLIITSGFSSFVTELILCDQLSVVGVLDCISDNRLKRYSENINLPYNILKEQDDQLIQWIKEKKPDVIAVFMMPFLLKKEIFSIPKYGSLNIHPSLLPKYRGPNPWFWVYYNMEQESGVTIHAINEKEDSGSIVFQHKFKIPLGTDLNLLRDESAKIGIKLMLEALCDIENINLIPQPIASPTHRARNIFDYTGMIDWQTWPVVRLWHLLSGFPDVINSNPNYHLLNKKLKPIGYNEDSIKIPIGQFILLDDLYTLKCIDGSILFEIDNFSLLHPNTQ